MNTKTTIVAATLAALLFSSGAFAASEDYPVNTNPGPAVTAGNYVNTQSSEAYPTFAPGLGTTAVSAPVLAQGNGSESSEESVNSVPRGFDVGTAAYVDRQIASRWFAQRAQARYATAQGAQPRG